MKCINHSSVEAEGICVKCGKPMCKECLVDVGGKNHCKQCLKKMTNLNESPTIVINNSNSNINAINSTQDADTATEAAVCCCCIIIIIAFIIGLI